MSAIRDRGVRPVWAGRYTWALPAVWTMVVAEPRRRRICLQHVEDLSFESLTPF